MKQLVIKNQITKRDEDSFGRYLREISKINQLTLEEETIYATRAVTGDQEAIDKLVQGNLRFVISVAKQYQHCGVPISDLVSAGNIGLMKAATKFDPTKGFKFISYAVWWIRQNITISISEHLKTIRLPANCEAALNEFHQVHEKLEQKLGREPSTDEIIENLSDDTRKGKIELYNTNYKPTSLDKEMGEDSETTLHDIIPDERALKNTLQLDKSMQRERLMDALKKLTPVELQVVTLRFGMDGQGARSYEEIGTIVDLTGERIRQIQQKALKKLRYRKGVKQIFDDYLSLQ